MPSQNQNKQKTYIIALGGNSLLRSHERGSIEEQYINLEKTSEQLVGLLNSGNRIVITHGNGPQVGNLLLMAEMAKDTIPPMPLDICGAATTGYMGYMIQQTVANHLRQKGLAHNITTVVTQVIVDKADPAFENPTKPVGSFYNAKDAEKLKQEKGWAMIEDSARGFRRVVPSPMPVKVQQARIISAMLDAGEIVIAVGGGGIPVYRESNGDLRGVEAVIDKDYASARLASEIGADFLVILTATEHVYRDFNKPTQKPLVHVTVEEARLMLLEGHFGQGSMQPKIEAAIQFLEDKKLLSEAHGELSKREVLITLPEKAAQAIKGITGTHIVK
ncbi:carbamate kinase [Chloroflexota bacterium]